MNVLYLLTVRTTADSAILLLPQKSAKKSKRGGKKKAQSKKVKVSACGWSNVTPVLGL